MSAFHALGLDECESAVVGLLDVGHILVSIAGGLVKGDAAGHAVIIHAEQGILDGGAVGASSAVI